MKSNMPKNKTQVKRKSISKKLRFEVFKRDSFICQYCGWKVQDVVLYIDHITPVSKDGQNKLSVSGTWYSVKVYYTSFVEDWEDASKKH